MGGKWQYVTLASTNTFFFKVKKKPSNKTTANFCICQKAKCTNIGTWLSNENSFL